MRVHAQRCWAINGEVMALRSFKDANSTEARQFLLDRRCERAHPKRHRTLKRSRKAREARKAKAKAKAALQARDRAKFLARVKAYWSGSAGEHP